VDTVGIALGDLRAGAVGFRGANKPSFVGRELAGRAHAPKAEGGFAPRKGSRGLGCVRCHTCQRCSRDTLGQEL
jgi:hypothetical protein